MGGNSPSHLSQEEGEGGGVTFVKGIRVSESSGSMDLKWEKVFKQKV